MSSPTRYATMITLGALLLAGCASTDAGSPVVGSDPTSTAGTTAATTSETTEPTAMSTPTSSAPSGGSGTGTDTGTTTSTTDASTSTGTGAPATSLDDLSGHTFTLVGTFTDAGGADTRYSDASYVITFAGNTAIAQTQCGTLEYSDITSEPSTAIGELEMDLGTPDGPECSLASDPGGVPAGLLYWGFGQGRYYLSTGFVAWYFEETTAPGTSPCPPDVQC